MVLTRDALHAQKKAAAIVASGNDYVRQVKGNQPTLRAAIQALHRADPAPAPATDCVRQRSRGAERKLHQHFAGHP